MAYLDVKLDRHQVSHTQNLTRTKALHGDQTHCGFTWKTLRSLSLVCNVNKLSCFVNSRMVQLFKNILEHPVKVIVHKIVIDFDKFFLYSKLVCQNTVSHTVTL